MATTSFARDIRPLFTDEDIEKMKEFGMDLSRRVDVDENKDDILDRLKRTGFSRMPPPPRPAWTAEQIDLFQRWMKEGCPA